MEILLLKKYVELLTALSLLLSQQLALQSPKLGGIKLGNVLGSATTTTQFLENGIPVQVKEVKPIKTFIRNKYANVFKDAQGNKIEIEITKQEYENLGKKNPVNPTLEGYTWISSYGGSPIYQEDEMLNNYEFIESTSTIKIKTPTKIEIIKKDEIVNSTINL